MIRSGTSGQSLMELVIGIGLVTVVAGAIAIVSINGLQNTQFAKNQVQATKLAQESLEKVRTIKNFNYGVCTRSQVELGGACSIWTNIWSMQFGEETTCQGCSFALFDNGVNTCTVNTGTGTTTTTPFCLKYSAARADLGNGFTGQVFIEDEATSQKRITSRVFWTDSSGEHSSDLVTILSRY